MSRYGSGKSYGRRTTECKSSLKFDQLLSENTNKPSTAKVSVAGGQRWGMTTFTSIRKTQINGRKDCSSLQQEDSNKRMKLGGNGDNLEDPFSFDCDGSPVKSNKNSTATNLTKSGSSVTVPKTSTSTKPNKFFKSGAGTRPLAVQNMMNRKKPTANANLISDKANSNTFALKQLSLEQFPASKPVVDQSIDVDYPKVSLNPGVQASFSNEESFSAPVPVVVTRKYPVVNNDPFDMLLSSIPTTQKSDLQSFSVERILGDDKFTSPSCGLTTANSTNNCYYSPPVTSQNDIFSPPSSQSYSGSNFGSQGSENDIFGSQSSVQSRYATNYGLDSCGSDILYSSCQSQPSYESDNFSANHHSSSPNKWQNYGSALEIPPEPVHQPAREVVPPQIFNPAFRTYGRSKERVQDNSQAQAISSDVSVVSSGNNVYSGDSYTATRYVHDVQILEPSASTSAYSNTSNVITNSQENDLDFSEPPFGSLNADEPMSQTAYSNLSESQNSAFSDGAPTDCSQESSSQNDLAGYTDSLMGLSSSQSSNGKSSRSQKSLFKSRKIFNSPKKMKAVYKYRPWHVDDDEHKEETSKMSEEKISLVDEFEDDEEEDDEDNLIVTQKLKLSKYVKKTTQDGEVITSWKCQRSVKELYTVVHNVKQAHQCHESGETQEFNDDVEYLLEGIQSSSSLGTRCLSTLGWATKCMGPSFRIHLRAHGTISKVFSALMDAPSDHSLSLSTATLMFVLSQDRLTMDLEASTLSLLLQLLECNSGESSQSSLEVSPSINQQQTEKIKEKVRSLCEEMQQKGYAKQLDLNNITAGILAMETLLSLSSRRTGEWFKEEIRTLGGLDYVVDTLNTGITQWKQVISVDEALPNELDQLGTIDRCLRVVENVTYQNQENQRYVLTYKNAVLVDSCISLLQLCRTCISQYPIDNEYKPLKSSGTPGAVLFCTIKTILKVLINITHENSLGSAIVGSQEGIMECLLLLILQTGAYIPQEERFDLHVLSFALLINFVEFCPENRDRLVLVRTVGAFDLTSNGEDMSCIEALIEVFVNRLDLAKQLEEQADALLDGQAADNNSQKQIESSSSSQVISQQAQVEQLEETLMKTLHKAGKNMEHSIIAAYVSLLFGCVIENTDYREMVRDQMPNESFVPMIEVLRKFLNFVNLTGVVSNAGLKSIKRVLQVLEAS